MESSFYIAARSAHPNGGIYRFELDENGVPRQKDFAPLENATSGHLVVMSELRAESVLRSYVDRAAIGGNFFFYHLFHLADFPFEMPAVTNIFHAGLPT